MYSVSLYFETIISLPRVRGFQYWLLFSSERWFFLSVYDYKGEHFTIHLNKKFWFDPPACFVLWTGTPLAANGIYLIYEDCAGCIKTCLEIRGNGKTNEGKKKILKLMVVLNWTPFWNACNWPDSRKFGSLTGAK